MFDVFSANVDDYVSLGYFRAYDPPFTLIVYA